MGYGLEQRMELLPGVPARELVRIPWLQDELAATETARERLRTWAEAGRPEPDLDGLACHGDEPIRETAIDVLGSLPQPVAWFIARRCTLLGVGSTSLGWIGPPLPTEPRLIIVVSARGISERELRGVIAHECAHGWLGHQPEAPRPSATTQQRQEAKTEERRIASLAIEWGNTNTLIDCWARMERQAAALTRRWGFHGPGADVHLQSCNARRRLERAQR